MFLDWPAIKPTILQERFIITGFNLATLFLQKNTPREILPMKRRVTRVIHCEEFFSFIPFYAETRGNIFRQKETRNTLKVILEI